MVNTARRYRRCPHEYRVHILAASWEPALHVVVRAVELFQRRGEGVLNQVGHRVAVPVCHPRGDVVTNLPGVAGIQLAERLTVAGLRHAQQGHGLGTDRSAR